MAGRPAKHDNKANLSPARFSWCLGWAWQNWVFAITLFAQKGVLENLGVENIVAEKFGTQYKPYHLLCKSHTVEKIDDSNLKVLAKVERIVNLREKLENVNPALKPFLGGKKQLF